MVSQANPHPASGAEKVRAQVQVSAEVRASPSSVQRSEVNRGSERSTQSERGPQDPGVHMRIVQRVRRGSAVMQEQARSGAV